MRKSPKTRETAKALVSPLFAWSNAVLKGGEMVLDSMQSAAKRAGSAAVAVIPTPDAPAPKRRPRAKPKARAQAKRRTKKAKRR